MTEELVAPPTAIDEERNVLGAMMIDGATVPVVFSLLRPENFYPSAHQEIFRAMIALHKDGAPIDLCSVGGHLKRMKKLDLVGGHAYLSTFEKYVLTTQNIGWYCGIVKDYWIRREMIQRGRELISKSHNTNTKLIDVAKSLQEAIDTTSDTANGTGPLKMMSVADIFEMKMAPEDSFVGDNIISAGELAIMVGPGGIGKSRLVIQLIIDIILNAPKWLDSLEIHRHDLKILVFQTENNARRFKRDLAGQMKGIYGVEREKLIKQLRIYVPQDVDDMHVSFDDPAIVERMSRTVIEHEPNLIIFDPWTAFNPSENENDALQTKRAVSTLMNIAHAWSHQTAVLLIHHSLMGKAAAAAAEGWDRGQYGRGSKALFNAARSQINLLPGDAEGETVLITCGKNNNGRMFKPFAAKLDGESMMYRLVEDFDLEEWRRTVNAKSGTQGRKRAITEGVLRVVIGQEGFSYGKLADALKAAAEVGESAARNAIRFYLDNGILTKDAEGWHRIAEK